MSSKNIVLVFFDSGNGPGYSGGGHGGGLAKERDEDEEALEERPEVKVEYGSLW